MAAGDISKKLVSYIRTKLGDDVRKHVKSNQVLYWEMTEYQRQWMNKYLIVPKTQTITMIADTLNYSLDSDFRSVNSVKSEDEDILDLQVKYDQQNNRIIVEEDCVQAGDTLLVSGFQKPVTTSDAATDDIGPTVDPIIGSDFHFLLAFAVLSQYRHLDESFASIEVVEKRVQSLANSTRGRDMTPVYELNMVRF